MLVYFLLLLIIGLLIFVVFRFRTEDEGKIIQQLQLEIKQGILEINKEQNNNSIAQVKEIAEIKKSVNDELHNFKVAITKLSDDQVGQTKDSLTTSFQKLQEQVEKRLEDINTKVENRLSKGFEETNKTFTNIIERLAKIDEAQKKIEILSKDVVSLQDILSDKKTRGTFGEVQLHQILTAVFGEKNDAIYELQKDLSDTTGKIGRVDAVIKLPAPTGLLPIDSKFSLENYRRMYDASLQPNERDEAVKLFKKDLQTRIDETAKYVVPGVTAEYAIMFLTAEAIFAEINAYHPKVIEYAHQKKVYIASPTTLLALMNTVQAVLKDHERSKLAEQIRKNLLELNAEFGRYKTRWDALSKHIKQVSNDVEDISTTTQKISQKFEKIHNAELPEHP